MPTITAFTKQMRGPGRIVSTQATVPTGGKIDKPVVCVAQMDAADLADVTLHLAFGAEYLDPDNVTWIPLATNGWDGGAVSKVDGSAIPPQFTVQSNDGVKSLIAGQPVRVFADLPRALSFGATATF